MHTASILAVLAAFPLALCAPSRLPHQSHKRCDNETTTPDALNESPISACSLAGVNQPPSSLPPPPAGTNLVLVALGVGTQNYTCGTNLTAAPASIGALATLHDASCSLSTTPNPASKAGPPGPDAEPLQFGRVAEAAANIGTHFFVDNTTPDFDIVGLGNTELKKTADAAAPNPAQDIKWLLLTTQAQGTTSQVKMIYRLNTKGGLQPTSCEGKVAGEVMTVPYEAQYWVYAVEQPKLRQEPVVPQSPPTQPSAEQFLGGAGRAVQVNLWVMVVSFALYMFCL